MALRKKQHDTHLNRKRVVSPTGIYPYMMRYLDISQTQGIAKDTLRRRDSGLRRFIEWCDARGLDDPRLITKPILECYQRHLYYYRKANGEPLSMSSQNVMLTPLKSFFKWLTHNNYLLYNPASELILPKKTKSLPRYILTLEEINNVFAQPIISTPEGLRDRALLETLYATGIRRSELANLSDSDIDYSRQTVLVKEGKGNRDRYLPLGQRAVSWIKRYQLETRPQLLLNQHERTLFLTDYGEPFNGGYLGRLVKHYLTQAGIDKPGSCHLFRHAMATHMLENGADIRFIQAMLGHRDLNTTEIYTRVSIDQLQSIHGATHPLAQS